MGGGHNRVASFMDGPFPFYSQFDSAKRVKVHHRRTEFLSYMPEQNDYIKEANCIGTSP